MLIYFFKEVLTFVFHLTHISFNKTTFFIFSFPFQSFRFMSWVDRYFIFHTKSK